MRDGQLIESQSIDKMLSLQFDHSTLWDERSELKTKIFLVVIFRLSSSKVDMM